MGLVNVLFLRLLLVVGMRCLSSCFWSVLDQSTLSLVSTRLVLIHAWKPLVGCWIDCELLPYAWISILQLKLELSKLSILRWWVLRVLAGCTGWLNESWSFSCILKHILKIGWHLELFTIFDRSLTKFGFVAGICGRSIGSHLGCHNLSIIERL